MKRLNLMKLNCAEAADVCTRSEYKEASFIERLRLRLHLYFCQNCRHYHDNNKKLTGLLKKANIKPCSSKEKEHFKETMKNGNSKKSE